jgi:hypothetical protein
MLREDYQSNRGGFHGSWDSPRSTRNELRREDRPDVDKARQSAGASPDLAASVVPHEMAVALLTGGAHRNGGNA